MIRATNVAGANIFLAYFPAFLPPIIKLIPQKSVKVAFLRVRVTTRPGHLTACTAGQGAFPPEGSTYFALQ